jgi:glutathione S-transferase
MTGIIRCKRATDMMALRSSPTSPFARKVRMCAIMLGLAERIEIVPADTMDPADSLRAENPLGKLPVLILEDGEAIYDSSVIVEYLDSLADGPGLIPSEPRARFKALTRQSLADGMQDAALLQRYEAVFRQEDRREPKWVAHHAEKVERALAFLSQALPAGPIDIGHVAIACALGYLDLRFAGKWRESHPALAGWLAAFAADVPAFAATDPRA